MYLSYYNLSAKPFQISADPKFLWLGEKHKEALAALKYGILDNKGFLLLTGDVGTGKTTLINALVQKLGDDVIVATVLDPGLDKLDFFNFLANKFKLTKEFTSKGDFLVHFNHFLNDAFIHNKQVLLIIDEAQRISQELLEEIRLLSNFEKQSEKLINIFFIGQNEFNDILLETRNRALLQRITINYHLDPFTENETKEYIRYRLRVAGSTKNIFSSGSIHKIYKFSDGYPRLINIICDYALLSGYAKEKWIIDSKIVTECAKELRISSQTGKKKENHRQAGEKINNKPIRRKGWYIGMFVLLAIITGFLSYSDQYSLRLTQFKNLLRTDQANNKINNVVTYSIKNNNREKQQTERSDSNNQQSSIDNHQSKIEEPPLQTEKKPVKVKKEIQATELSDETIPADKIVNKPQIFRIPDKNIIIYFEYNSNELPVNTYEALDRVAAIMMQNPEIEIAIKGYTDRLGRYLYNIRLSEFRANMVKSYLVGKGIETLRIKSFGMGPVKRANIDEVDEKNGSNRRVEIEFVSQN